MGPERGAGASRARKRRSGRASLKHIADATGYSVTTVSAVLGGRADKLGIASSTRVTILAAAKELDYRPNLHARSLRSRTTTLVGLMVPTLNNRFFSEMAETFERVARNDGKLPLITVTNYDRQEEAESLKYYLSQDVQCVFNANPTGIAELTALCRTAGTRQILLDAPDSASHTVTTDNYDASLVLTRVLVESLSAGERKGRVYFVGGMADHEVTKLRLAGFRAALQEKGIRYSSDQFIDTLFNAESAYRRIELLFRSHSDVAGIYVNSLLPMDGVVRFFGEHTDLCRRVHYGVFDYHPMMDLLVDLHIGAIRQNPELMMQRAWEIFADPAAHQPERTQYVPYELILAPPMRRFLPEPRRNASQGRSRESGS
jgi:DNA-binding LacI/PurR family transcriptional regulator